MYNLINKNSTIKWYPSPKKVFGENKWVAKIHHLGNISLDDITTTINDSSTAKSSEVEGIILAYINRIHFYILKGRSVNIEGLGTFYPKISGKMVANREDVSVKNCIKNITVGFRPDAGLTAQLKKTSLQIHRDPKLKNDKEVAI